VIAGVSLFELANLDPAVASEIRGGSSYSSTLEYYLIAYVVFSLAIATGFRNLLKGWSDKLLQRKLIVLLLAVVLPVALYAAAPGVARKFLKEIPGLRTMSTTDNFTYILSPWKQGVTGARAQGEEMLTALLPQSVLFADYSNYWVVRYLQVVEKSRPDIILENISPDLAQIALQYHLEGRANYLTNQTILIFQTDRLHQNFILVPEGKYLQRLTPKFINK
jgi:hypothetical protein